MPEYRSLPHSSQATDIPIVKYNKEAQFGTARIGQRSDEDGLYWKTLEPTDLTPAGEETALTPQEIAHRLWTSYLVLNDTFKNERSGTTASTTVYDGQGNLITATLADSVSFVAVYDKEGKVLEVLRLNLVTHKADDLIEYARIHKTGGYISHNRLLGSLAVTRAIGDRSFQKAGLISEATINITSVNQIAKQLGIDPKQIGKFQVITATDGFTDGTLTQTKPGHEGFLRKTLEGMSKPGMRAEHLLAAELVNAAESGYSRDDILVGIQSFTIGSPAFFMGAYDGHGGHQASEHVVEKIGPEFTKLCQLSRTEYANHAFSVHKKQNEYKRDNPHSFEVPLGKQLPQTKVPQSDSRGQGASAALPDELIADEMEAQYKSIILNLLTQTKKYHDDLKGSLKPDEIRVLMILNTLINKLSNAEKTNKAKIQDFYSFLNSSPEYSFSFSYNKNIDIIKADKHVSAAKYLAFIAIVAASIATYVLPAVFVAGIVYIATGKTPFDLLRTRGGQYEKEVSVMKQRYQFFTSADAGDRASEQQQASKNGLLSQP